MRIWDVLKLAYEENRSFDSPTTHIECVGGQIIFHFKRTGGKFMISKSDMECAWVEDEEQSYKQLRLFDHEPV